MKKLTIFIIIIILLFIISHKKNNNIENFHGHNSYKHYCPDCGLRGRYKCQECHNCGYCITSDGRGECVPGDNLGPYFRQDCYLWEHNRPLMRQIRRIRRIRRLLPVNTYSSNYIHSRPYYY